MIVETTLKHHDEIRKLPLQILSGRLRNSIVMGVTLGFALNLLDVSIPATLDVIIASIAKAAPACALFAFGASLSQYQITGDLREPLMIVSLKNFVHPLIIWVLATMVFSVPPL